MSSKSFVLITPARNEERYVRNTINSVISQTVLPKKWVIVSDGSTDGTDEIVTEYARKFDFIKLLRVEAGKQRTFGSKVNAIKYGCEQLKDVEYDFIGNLDADVSFELNYYEKILKGFQENPKLGIAGGTVVDFHEGRFIKRGGNTNHVAGAVQLFRRECYDTIGGFASVKAGIEDTVAEVMARMTGWEVRSFPEIRVIHHRRTGTEGQSIYSARFLMGEQDYFLGYHPLFEIAKCVYRLKDKPYVLGSLLWMCGYFRSTLRRDTRTVSADFVRYLRRQQMRELWSRLTRT
jgi:biofilm PGA synthesis N-glycosyltransferase PgaC